MALVPPNDLTVTIADMMLDCLCAAVAERANPPLHCRLRMGIDVVMDVDQISDLCCEGLAYVMPGDAFPSYQFPNQDITRQAEVNCGIISWGIEFRAGIMRCAPSGGDNGEMPTDDEWTEAAWQSLLDSTSLRRFACCVPPTLRQLPDLDGLSIIAGRIQQGAIQGGCVERSITMQIQIPGDCCPPLSVD